MKKLLLTAAVASAFSVSAMADVSVYGKANVALQHADEAAAGDSTVELVSNASRIGVKGSEEISSGINVIYQFEYQTEVDDGTNGTQTFGQRNIYLGLQGKAGTVMAGHFDTPTKMIQEKVDLFNDMEGDIGQIFKGEIRASNVVQYTSPSLSGMTAAVAYITEENDGVTKRGDADAGVSLSVAYTSKNLYAAVAVDRDVEGENIDLIRAVVRANMGPLQLGLLAESYDKDGVDESGVVVSAAYALNNQWVVKAQHGQSDVRIADGESTSFGADYKMSKSTTVYSYATLVESSTGRDDTYVGIGMDYKF